MRDKLTVKTLWLLEAGVLGLALGAGAGCSSTSKTTGNVSALPADVQAITFLQRTPRNDDGNVFDYANFVPGGRLSMLSPPSADGQLTVIFPNTATCTALLKNMDGTDGSPTDIANCVSGSDVQSYDLSFDAKSVVFSAQLPGDDSYQIYSINLDATNPDLKQLTSGGNDFVYPVYAPGDRVTFMTNRNVEADADLNSMQFKDEYERAVTAQVGSVTTSGTDLQLGPRNVSHRVSPALLPDGHVLYTEWMHMGEVNEGHLRMMNTDMTGMKEAFGDELAASYPSTNSYLKARYVKTTPYFDVAANKMLDDYQVIAVATSRDRTLQSGKLFLIDLNGSEANSTSQDLTPLIPGDRSPSSQGIGRYYDAEPVGDEAPGQFLTSWADGPVQSEELDRAMSTAQFGIYVLDASNANASNGGRSPIYDDPNYWDVLPRPVKMRPEPANLASPDQHDRHQHHRRLPQRLPVVAPDHPAGERGEGAAHRGLLGRRGGRRHVRHHRVRRAVEIRRDSAPGRRLVRRRRAGQRAAAHPAGRQVRHGHAGQRQPRHGGGHAGRQRGHLVLRPVGRVALLRRLPREPHRALSTIQQGQTQAVVHGPVNLDAPRAARQSTTAYALTNGALPAGTNAANPGDNDVRGVPWDLAIQPILDAQVRLLPQRRRHPALQPELHRHRHDQRDLADLRVRPARTEAQRHRR